MIKVIKVSTGCYQKNKERHPKEAREKYQNLSEEDKNKMRKVPRKGYQNISEKKKKASVSSQTP